MTNHDHAAFHHEDRMRHRGGATVNWRTAHEPEVERGRPEPVGGIRMVRRAMALTEETTPIGSCRVRGDDLENQGERLALPCTGTPPGEHNWGDGMPASVGSYPADGYGLLDMAATCGRGPTTGAPRRGPPTCPPTALHTTPWGSAAAGLDPRQPQFPVPRKVIKGGSFLCAVSAPAPDGTT